MSQIKILLMLGKQLLVVICQLQFDSLVTLEHLGYLYASY